MRNKKGFTLIELLVVIAIIGLLSTLSILALNSARARSRDAKRISDIKQMQTALEMYYNEFNTYPPTAEVVAGASIGTGTAVYLREIPVAPLPADGTCKNGSAPDNTYKYDYFGTAANPGAATYSITYCLGAATGGVKAGAQLASPAGIGLK